MNGEFVKGRSGPMGDKGEAGLPIPGTVGMKGEPGPRGPVGLDADQKCKIPTNFTLCVFVRLQKKRSCVAFSLLEKLGSV